MHELKKIDEEVFLDRDGQTFETLVNYLRNDRKVFPEFTDKNSENMFYKEINYWGIDQHMKTWQEEYLKKLDKSIFMAENKQSPQSKVIKLDDSSDYGKNYKPTMYPDQPMYGG